MKELFPSQLPPDAIPSVTDSHSHVALSSPSPPPSLHVLDEFHTSREKDEREPAKKSAWMRDNDEHDEDDDTKESIPESETLSVVRKELAVTLSPISNPTSTPIPPLAKKKTPLKPIGMTIASDDVFQSEDDGEEEKNEVSL